MKTKAEIIAKIERCNDEGLLRNWIANARKEGAHEVADAAFKRLIELLPQEKPGTLEWEFWCMIHAFELMLSDEKGKTIRLSRTRQKVQRDGVHKTLTDWALGKEETAGFAMLLERNMVELSGEAIILRHPARFDAEITNAAFQRLKSAGVDIDKLPDRVASNVS